MIKKLHSRILTVSLTILITMLVLILSGIYLLMYNSEVKQAESTMKLAMESNISNKNNQPMPPDNQYRPPESDEQTNSRINSQNQNNSLTSKSDSSAQTDDADSSDEAQYDDDDYVSYDAQTDDYDASSNAQTDDYDADVNPNSNQNPESSSDSSTRKPYNRTQSSAYSNTPSERNPFPQKQDRFNSTTLSNTIYIEVDQNKEISYIQYRYWDEALVDDEFVQNAISLALNNDAEYGKFKVDTFKLRYMTVKTPNGYQIVLLNRSAELSTLNRLLLILIIIGCTVSAVFVVLSILLANWVVKPVSAAWEKQKQFVADASHELKTPLTIISANTDVILSNQDDLVLNQKKWLGYIKDETQRMSKLVSNLLSLAKADSQAQYSIQNYKIVNLSHLVSGVCLVFEPLFFENGKTLSADIQQDILFNCDEDLLKQLVFILIDNALKHSGKNAVVNVVFKKENKKIVLEVSNTESNIPKNQIKKIFERFYRIDESRNRNTGGSGLGLNIAQTIVLNHKGSIKAKSHDNLTVFTVTF